MYSQFWIWILVDIDGWKTVLSWIVIRTDHKWLQLMWPGVQTTHLTRFHNFYKFFVTKPWYQMALMSWAKRWHINVAEII